MRGLALAILITFPLTAMAEDAPPAPLLGTEARPVPRPVTGAAPRPPSADRTTDAPASEAPDPDAPAPDAPATDTTDIPADTPPKAGTPDMPAPDSQAVTAATSPAMTVVTPGEPAMPPMREQLRESDFDHAACLLELRLLGADYDLIPPLAESSQPDCGIARPILLRRPLPGIQIDGGAQMRCDTARHLAHWLRDFVRPAAAMLPGQPRLIALEPGSTYQCRATIGGSGAKTSEHAFGNAFDIAAFRFDDDTRLAVEPREDSGDLAEAFQRAVRASACLHFTTVLGPGANAAHDDHLHLDIKARKGGWRLCQ